MGEKNKIKNANVVIPISFLFSLFIWPVNRPNMFWGIIKCNHIVMPITSPITDVVSLYEQINMALSAHYPVSNPETMLFLLILRRTCNQK